MPISDEEPVVHEVKEITPEVYKDAEEDEALDTGRVVIVNVVDETESSDEQK